jgi:SAM-dependent methyltransferase
MADESSPRQYVLGSRAQELARLDVPARMIEPATRLLLRASGIGSGARALDLGTGLGHVAQLVAEMVGPTGSVVGLDQSAEMLAEAGRRSDTATAGRITFVQGDVTTWRDGEPFDVIVGRLLLFHVANPVQVVRHHGANLRQNGRFVAIDFDIGGSRSEPRVALVEEVGRWIVRAFAAAGASPMIGARLGAMLQDAGLTDVTTFGIQGYLPPGSPAGPALLAGVVRSLADAIVAHGIATREQMGLETLETRLAAELSRANAVMLPPTVAGAWGRRDG